MPDTPPSSGSGDSSVLDRITRSIIQPVIQLFTVLAGVAGLFYAIGFIIVNVNLLQLGVYEPALVSVGYVAPGVAFVLIFALSAVVSAIISTVVSAIASVVAFAVLRPESMRRVIAATPQRVRESVNKVSRPAQYIVAVVLSIIGLGVAIVIILFFSRLVGWVAWFGRNEATSVTNWCAAVGLVVAGLIYAEHLWLLWQAFKQRKDTPGNLFASAQVRLKSPVFLSVLVALTFFSVLAYGQSVYGQIPSVFGGGQPLVVRFYGPEVAKLTTLGVPTEPGETELTERVALIAQTEDRYIVLVGQRAISFDQSFVQGLRYEPPEFFLDPNFVIQTHTQNADQLAAAGDLDAALSEYRFVLARRSDHVPALRGRAQVFLSQGNYLATIDDYKLLIQYESTNPENFYTLATLQERVRTSLIGPAIKATEVISHLVTAKTIDPQYFERARLDETFVGLRGHPDFDQAIYDGGANAARWFAARARNVLASGYVTDSIRSYQWAITYTRLYAGAPGALSKIDLAGLHLSLGTLYRQRDPLSLEAELEFRQAVSVTNVLSPTYLIALADFFRERSSLPNAPATDLSEALKYYDLALGSRIDPTVPDRRQALIGQGRIALERGTPGDLLIASRNFSEALSIASGDASVWYDYARALARQAGSDPDTIRTALRRALDLDQSLAEAALGIDRRLYFSNVESAIGPMLIAAQHNLQGRTYRDAGQIDLAVTELISATLADAGVRHYWRDLADVQFQRGAYAEAATAYQNAIDRSPTPDTPDPELLTLLGRARAGNAEDEAAVAAFRAAIDAVQGAVPPTTYEYLGDALYRLARYDEAAAAYQQAGTRDTNNLYYPYRQGLSLFRAGKTSEAQTALQSIFSNSYLVVSTPDGANFRGSLTAPTTLNSVSKGTVLVLLDGPQSDGVQTFWHVRDPVSALDGYILVDVAVPTAPPTMVAPVQQTTP